MKIYLTPPQPSRGLQRIADALVRYKPGWVEVVGTQAEAELVIIYAIGRCNQVHSLADYLLSTGRKYAVIQVCLRSTMSPHTDRWLELWDKAETIWSYYDLKKAIALDNDYGPLEEAELDNFYHAPLGVEADVFYPRVGLYPADAYPNRKYFKIATSGLSYLSESVRECWLAAREASGMNVLHIGRQFDRENVVCADGISDDQLAEELSACEFVSALRRKEGFELPAAEGLLCGARPIAFDTPDYRWIYKSWAEYVYEGTRQEVVDQLVTLFRQGARPVTELEIAGARAWFHWPTIIGGFYERLR